MANEILIFSRDSGSPISSCLVQCTLTVSVATNVLSLLILVNTSPDDIDFQKEWWEFVYGSHGKELETISLEWYVHKLTPLPSYQASKRNGLPESRFMHILKARGISALCLYIQYRNDFLSGVVSLRLPFSFKQTNTYGRQKQFHPQFM